MITEFWCVVPGRHGRWRVAGVKEAQIRLTQFRVVSVSPYRTGEEEILVPTDRFFEYLSEALKNNDHNTANP